MVNRSEKIAIISLVVALTVALFNFYQWWNGERQSRITASVEISKAYVQENRQRLIELMISLKDPSHQMSAEEVFDLYRYLYRLEYISFLANHDRLDFEYLARGLKCDIYHFWKFLDSLPNKDEAAVRFSFAEMKSLASKIPASLCPLAGF